MGVLRILLVAVLPLICCAMKVQFHPSMMKRQTHDWRTIQTIEDVKKYLIKYNYLSESLQNDAEEVEDQIKVFQNFANLEITGNLTEETKAAMRKPRCGCPDVRKEMVIPNSRNKRDLERFTPKAFTANSRWPTNTVTWRIDGFTQKLDDFLVRREIIRAFDLWAAVSPLQFVEQRSGAVDIEIDFFRGNHGDGNGFDGRSGVLAHAFFPRNGMTHFDDDENWVFNSSKGIDFFTVAAHEFGHALGLGHSQVTTALMAPFYAGFVQDFKLDRDDIAGIQNIYGPPTNNPRPTSRPRPTTTTTTTRRPTRRTTTTTPTPPRGRPQFCDWIYNAAMEDDNGELLFFRRSTFVFPPYYQTRGGPASARVARTRSYFQGAPTNPDAIFNHINGTYFIRRQLVYRFSRVSRLRRRLDGMGYRINMVMRERIRAAVAISENDVYLIGSTKVWKFNTARFEVIRNSERDLADEFPGIPSNVDAAVSYDSTRIVFIVGRNFYLFDTSAGRTVIGPRDFSSQFIGGPCRI